MQHVPSAGSRGGGRAVSTRPTVPCATGDVDALATILATAYLRILDRRDSQGSSRSSGEGAVIPALVKKPLDVSPEQSVSVRTPAGSPSGTKEAPR